MRKNKETLDLEMEVIIDYNYVSNDSDNPHEGLYNVILNSVSIQVGKKLIDILPILNEDQIQYFIDKLNFE